MIKTVLVNPWVQALGGLLGFALVCLIAYVLSPVLVPLLIALFTAYILDPVVDMMERRKVRRSITIAALAFAGFLVLVLIPFYFIPDIVHEADQLIKTASSGAIQNMDSGWMRTLVDKLPLDMIVRQMGLVDPSIEIYNPREVFAKWVGETVKGHALNFLRSYGGQILAAGASASMTAAMVVTSVWQWIGGMAELIGRIALFAVVAAYLLHDFDGITAAAADLVPPRCRTRIFDIIGKIDLQLRSFFRGQLIVCACLGAMYALGLFISGVPFGVLLGLLGGAASFIPYLGMALTIIPAILLTLLQHGIDWHVIGVLVTFGVAQTIESMVLTPRIVGEQVGLGPVWVILAIMVFGSLLGFLGLLLAVPIAAVLKVVITELVAVYRGSYFFSGAAGSDDSG